MIIKPTELEQKIIDKHIKVTDNGGRLRNVGGRYCVQLKVDDQLFTFDFRPNTQEEVDACTILLARAILKLRG